MRAYPSVFEFDYCGGGESDLSPLLATHYSFVRAAESNQTDRQVGPDGRQPVAASCALWPACRFWWAGLLRPRQGRLWVWCLSRLNLSIPLASTIAYPSPARSIARSLARITSNRARRLRRLLSAVTSSHPRSCTYPLYGLASALATGLGRLAYAEALHLPACLPGLCSDKLLFTTVILCDRKSSGPAYRHDGSRHPSGALLPGLQSRSRAVVFGRLAASGDADGRQSLPRNHLVYNNPIPRTADLIHCIPHLAAQALVRIS